MKKTKVLVFLGISIIIAIIAEVLGFKVTVFAATAAAALKPAVPAGAAQAGVAHQLQIIAKELKPAKPAAALGNWLAPIFYLAAFAFLAIGALHIDVPDAEGKRKKFNPMGIGIISLLVGLMWWPYIIAMMVAQGLGAAYEFCRGASRYVLVFLYGARLNYNYESSRSFQTAWTCCHYAGMVCRRLRIFFSHYRRSRRRSMDVSFHRCVRIIYCDECRRVIYSWNHEKRKTPWLDFNCCRLVLFGDSGNSMVSALSNARHTRLLKFKIIS